MSPPFHLGPEVAKIPAVQTLVTGWGRADLPQSEEACLHLARKITRAVFAAQQRKKFGAGYSHFAVALRAKVPHRVSPDERPEGVRLVGLKPHADGEFESKYFEEPAGKTHIWRLATAEDIDDDVAARLVLQMGKALSSGCAPARGLANFNHVMPPPLTYCKPRQAEVWLAKKITGMGSLRGLPPNPADVEPIWSPFPTQVRHYCAMCETFSVGAEWWAHVRCHQAVWMCGIAQAAGADPMIVCGCCQKTVDFSTPVRATRHIKDCASANEWCWEQRPSPRRFRRRRRRR